MSERLKHHPIASLIPMMPEPELAALQAKMVEARQQLVPAVTLDGMLLDGRHRAEVCDRLGWTLKTITWEQWLKQNQATAVPPPTPLQWVLSINVDRRHLNESQRAMIGARALELQEAEAKKRMSAGGKNKPGKGAPRGAPLRPDANGREQADITKFEYPKPGKKKPARASEAAAKAVGASSRSIDRAKRVLETRPDLAKLIDEGKKKLAQVEKAIKKEAALKNVLEYRPPVGTYAVIVADVPWEYDDKLDGSDQVRGGTGYPTMPLEEILAIKPPAAPDCALWFWTTNAFLIDGTAAQVVKAWGFEAKALYTWRKVDKNGNDRLGSGHYGRNVTEHLILAVKGKPMVDGARQPNIFDAPRGGHSEKPDRLFEIAEKVTPCPPEARIELFAIDKRPGWDVSGSEQQAKARAERGGMGGPHDSAADLVPAAATSAAPLIEWTDCAMKKGKVVATGIGGARTDGGGRRKYEIAKFGDWKTTDTSGLIWVGGRAGDGFRTDQESYVTTGAAKSAAERAEEIALQLARQVVVAPETIAWKPKKHPSIVAIGEAKERRFTIETNRKRNASMPSNKPGGKKIDGYNFFWRCEGTSSKLFDDEPTAKRDATQWELLQQSAELDQRPSESAPVDDGTLCGIRPSKNGDGCIHKRGHSGVHSNGRTTWSDRKGRKLPALEDVIEAGA